MWAECLTTRVVFTKSVLGVFLCAGAFAKGIRLILTRMGAKMIVSGLHHSREQYGSLHQ